MACGLGEFTDPGVKWGKTMGKHGKGGKEPRKLQRALWVWGRVQS